MSNIPKEQHFKITFETCNFADLAFYYVKNELNLTPEKVKLILENRNGENAELGEDHVWEEIEVTVKKENR